MLVVVTVGVPVISQVLDSESPVGRVGESLHDTIVPPELITGRGVIAVLTTNVSEASL